MCTQSRPLQGPLISIRSCRHVSQVILDTRVDIFSIWLVAPSHVFKHARMDSLDLVKFYSIFVCLAHVALC
jgi:hypothetical protein